MTNQKKKWTLVNGVEISDEEIHDLARELLIAARWGDIEAALAKYGLDVYDTDQGLWRFIDDNPGNIREIHSQANRDSLTPLVETLTNAADAYYERLSVEYDIPMKGEGAPKSGREFLLKLAVKLGLDKPAPDNFYGNDEDFALLLLSHHLHNWTGRPGRIGPDEDRAITLSFTDRLPGNAASNNNPGLVVADRGVGMSPTSLERTVCSLSRSDKRDNLVQNGTYGLGGLGSLKFCGASGSSSGSFCDDPKPKTIVTRAIPGSTEDEYGDYWSVTIQILATFTDENGHPRTAGFWLCPVEGENNEKLPLVFTNPEGGFKGMPAVDAKVRTANDKQRADQTREPNDIPFQTPMEYGTVVKLHDYDLDLRTQIHSQTGSVERLCVHLFDFPMGVMIYENRAFSRGTRGGKQIFKSAYTELFLGSHRRWVDGVNASVGPEGDFQPGRGSLLYNPYRVPLKMSGGETIWVTAYCKLTQKNQILLGSGRRIAHGIEGRTQGFSVSHVMTTVGWTQQLAESLIFYVDHSEVVQKYGIDEVFLPTRDQLNRVYPYRNAILQAISDLVKNDPVITRWCEEQTAVARAKAVKKGATHVDLGKVDLGSHFKGLFVKGSKRTTNKYKGFDPPRTFEPKLGQFLTRGKDNVWVTIESDGENGLLERTDPTKCYHVTVMHNGVPVVPIQVIWKDGLLKIQLEVDESLGEDQSYLVMVWKGSQPLGHLAATVNVRVTEARQKSVEEEKEDAKGDSQQGGDDKPKGKRRGGGSHMPKLLIVHREQWGVYGMNETSSSRSLPATNEVAVNRDCEQFERYFQSLASKIDEDQAFRFFACSEIANQRRVQSTVLPYLGKYGDIDHEEFVNFLIDGAAYDHVPMFEMSSRVATLTF